MSGNISNILRKEKRNAKQTKTITLLESTSLNPRRPPPYKTRNTFMTTLPENLPSPSPVALGNPPLNPSCFPETAFLKATNSFSGSNHGDSDDEESVRPQKPSLWRQLYIIFFNPDEKDRSSELMAAAVGLFTAVGGFLYGYDTGVANGFLAMPWVRSVFPSNGSYFSSTETSLITSILSLGTFFGALFSPFLSDTLGRRWAIIISTTLIFNVGVVLQIISKTITLLCVGRCIAGFGVGIVSAVVPVYQSEAAPKWVRGAIVCTYQWAITLGLLLSSVLAQATHKRNDSGCYRIPIALQLSWSLALGFGMFFLPDTPRFYVKNNQIAKAAKSLSRLRKLPITDPDLIEELVEIKANHDYEASLGESTLRDCFRRDKNKQLLRMITGMSLQALQQLTGVNFVIYYGTNFFEKSGIPNSFLMSCITNVVNVVATFPGMVLVELIGRRNLLVFGAVGMAVCDYIISIVGMTTDNSIVANRIMITFICLFIAFFAATWGPVAWVVVGEMYPLRLRGKSVALAAASNWLLNFAVSYATPYLVDGGKGIANLGSRIFLVWGSCNVVSAIFAYFIIYETQGLTLEEVDQMYMTSKNAIASAKFKPRSRKLRNQQQQEQEQEMRNNLFNFGQDDVSGLGNINSYGGVPTLNFQFWDQNGNFKLSSFNSQPSSANDTSHTAIDTAFNSPNTITSVDHVEHNNVIQPISMPSAQNSPTPHITDIQLQITPNIRTRDNHRSISSTASSTDTSMTSYTLSTT